MKFLMNKWTLMVIALIVGAMVENRSQFFSKTWAAIVPAKTGSV